MPFLLEIFKTPESSVYIAIAALVVFLTLFLWLIYLNYRIKRLLGGSSAKNIEEAIKMIREEISGLNKYRDESARYLRNAEERLRRSVQAVETIRFNPFKGTGDGGNQSFSTAIINENGDGIIISSLYSRERVSIFSKPIKRFVPQHELSEEEVETLSRAKESLEKQSSQK